MWAWLYLAVGAVAMSMTWAFAVREEAIVFSTAIAAVSWSLLSLTSELAIIDGGEKVSVAVGPVRWLFAALALLSLLALALTIIGVYPSEGHPDQTHSRIQQ